MYKKSVRFFENSGIVDPATSYYVPMENVGNTDNQDIQTMIDRGRYFSIFAPRQSGKSTFIEELCAQLHRDPTYVALTLSFQEFKELDVDRFYAEIENNLYPQFIDRLNRVNCEKTEAVRQFLHQHHLTNNISFRFLFEGLMGILQHKKIVLFIDEFDGIPRNALEGFLTTLRELYLKYKKASQKALHAVALVGIRNITKLVVGGVSPFNIADQVNLPPFSLKNIRDLYGQYTAETNQPFTEAAIEKVHTETGGQTWLVNRLATILTVNIKPETVEPIDEPDVNKSIQILIKERNSHFDNLDEKAKQFKETFIEIVFDGVEYNPGKEDQTWLEQFGLIKNRDDKAVVANNIYKMRYLKVFFDEVAENAYLSPQFYDLPGGRLDMKNILLDFDRYVAQIGVRAFYENKKPYEKTGQFLLTAWLYQFVRGGSGDLRYESITGLGRMDIILNYKNRKYIIETKVNHRGDKERLIEQGILQVTRKYLVTETAGEGFLVIFDAETPAGTTVEPTIHTRDEKSVTCFIIGIGYQE
ncbi:MAG: AAA-like domain-containing protein [Candidatus Omnitrophota bacterium]